MPPTIKNPKSERPADRKVQGTLFLDYVRMIKRQKQIDWSKYLKPADLAILQQRIVETEWYPMETFERMGLGILAEVAGGKFELVRLFGHAQIDELAARNPDLVAEGEPRESLIYFQVERGSYFNFDAVNILDFFDNYARVAITYYMSPRAEQAACWQALGYIERLLELSGATSINCGFTQKIWAGDPTTILEIDWSNVAPDNKVKGSLFMEYARAVKARKQVDWSKYLLPRDLELLAAEDIREDAWYPMEIFERMGAGIFQEIGGGDLEIVRRGGRQIVDSLVKVNPKLLCPDDPLETLLRFQVLRRSFFNYTAIDIATLHDNYAKLLINYNMRRTTEAAAVYQSAGFFEKLLELNGAKNVQSAFLSKSWEGEPTTILELTWM